MDLPLTTIIGTAEEKREFMFPRSDMATDDKVTEIGSLHR